MKFSLLLALLFPILAWAEADKPLHQPSRCIASQEGLPTSIVNGSVCAITGEFLDSQIDLVLPGPQPLVLQRIYNNGNREEGSLENSWEFAFPSQINLRKYEEFRPEKKAKECYDLVITEASGAKLSYSAKKSHQLTHFLNFNIPFGFTNASSGSLSARTNLKNQQLLLYKGLDRIDVKEPNGDTRVYRLQQKKHDNYFFGLSQQVKMNRQKLFYGYDEGRLSFIQGEHWNGPVYNRLDFNYSLKNDKQWIIKTSDDRELTYHFEKQNVGFYLTKVEGTEHPNERFEYARKSIVEGRYHDYHIIKKKLPNQRYLENIYYMPGDNYIGQCKIHLPSRDARIDRVKEQKAPLGADASPITAYQYIYHTDLKRQPEVEGITRVVDALGGIKEYQYDQEQRLTAIETYVGRFGGAPFQKHSMVRYFLGAKHIADSNNLLTRTFEDHTGSMHEAHGYWYDQAGNVICERLFGNLSGQCTVPPTVSANGYPPQNGCENYAIHYSYSQDALHLLLEERADNGKGVKFKYLPDSTLISNKFLLDRDRIIKREFFEYDSMAVVEKTIVDDGINENPYDLTGVTERRILYTFNRKTAPFGLVEKRIESYLDLTTGQEKQLSKILYSYSKQGRLLKEDRYDADNIYCYSLHWEYDSHGNVTKEVNACGFVTIFKYDANDNLIFKQSSADSYYTKYEYDYSDRLICEKEHHQDGNCFITSHRYDYLHNRVATIDSYGNETRYIYDDLSRLIQTIKPSAVIENFNYNIYDKQTYVKDANGNITTTTYNIRGKPTTISYPNGTEERFIYNLDGTLKTAIAANGTYTEYSYDALGRVLQEQVFGPDLLTTKTAAYNGFHKVSETDAEGILTHYSYDGAGRLVCTITAGKQEKIEYDSLGRLKKTKTYYGYLPDEYTVKAFEYDFLNHLLEERTEDSQGHILHKISYTVDGRGNRLTTRIGNTINHMEYDGHNHLIKTTDALGNVTRVHYNHRYRNELNQNVLQKIITDPLGNQTVYTYDALSRLVTVEQKNNMGINTAVQEIFYDAEGNRTKTLDSVIIEGSLRKIITTLWQYNVVNQVVHLTEAAATPEQKDTHYLYNEYGQKSAHIKPDGVVIHYTYGAEGLLKTIISSDKTVNYHYLYNHNHEPIEVKDDVTNTTTKRIYDHNRFLIEEQLAHGHHVHYEYDRAGRVTKVALSTDNYWTYHYDAAFLRRIDRWQGEQLLYSHHYQEYDPSGLLKKSLLPNHSGKIDYHYDLMQRVNQIRAPTWQQHDIEYDSVGNLCRYEIEDSRNTFTYDSLYHLKSENGHSNHAYQTDSLHNRVLKDETKYTINSLNQLLAQGKTSYQYDFNGNLISKNYDSREKGSLQSINYRYDALDRLIEVTTDGQATSYIYDPFNRRLTKKDQTITEEYLYQGQNEIGAIQEGQIKELRLLGIGKGAEIGAAVALELNNQLFIPIHDHHGNVISLLNSDGEQAERYRYSAFGEITIYNTHQTKILRSAVGNPWLFASKRFDSETGFIFFGRRHYDPEVGRWLTPDPIGYTDGPNLYAYLHHNPLNSIDLYGLEKESRNSLDGPRRERIRTAQNGQPKDRQAEPSRNREDHGPSFWSDDASGRATGIAHGAIDFAVDSWHDYNRVVSCIGTSEMTTEESQIATEAVALKCMEEKSIVDEFVVDLFAIDANNTSYNSWRSYTNKGLQAGTLLAGAYGAVKGGIALHKVLTRSNKMLTWSKPLGNHSKLIRSTNTIHVTPDGVAMPFINKYKIAGHYVENTKRFGSYGEYINGKFVEKLRIDPATLPGTKGPNFSHYHLNGRREHYAPLPGMHDPGFYP